MDPNIQLQLEKALGQHDSGNELSRLLPKLPEPKRDIKVFGQSIALLSAQAGWWDVVDQLVNKYGCIPSNDEIDPMNGRTVLHYACDDDKAKSKTVEMLTTVCLFNPMQEDNDQETPVYLSTGMKKQFLKDLIDQSKSDGFENVVDYLKHKRDKSVHQTMTKAVSETDDNSLSLYKLYICGKPWAGTTELKHIINLQEPTNRKKKIFVTDFNIADHQMETPDSLGVFYCIHSHFIVSIRLLTDDDNDPNYELIDRMCQLAKSIADRTKQKFIPKVFIITTCADDRKNRKYLQKLNEKLESLYSTYYEVLVPLPDDKKQFIYQIDTAVEGSIRKQCADELQKHIFLAIDQPGIEPIKLPQKWFELLKHLENETGIVNKSQCYNKKLKMRPDEIERALIYLESMMLLYRPDEDILITKIDIFIEKLLCLLKASSDKESMLLRKRGLFKKTLLRKRCTDPTRDILSDDIFLKLLERFRLAACTTGGVAGASGRGMGGGDEFFIPSILSTESPSNEIEHEGGISPLALVWDQHVLPHGFFLAFVMELNKFGKKDHCRFQPCNDETPTIKSIHLIEANQRLPGVLKLTDNGKWIGVSYSRGANPDCCPMVLDIIDRGIQQVIKLYESTGITSPIIRCVCPLCKENDHYCYAYSSQHKFVICSKTPSKTGSLTPDIQCWLQGSRIKHKEETSVISRVHPEKDQPVDSRTLYSTNIEDYVAVLNVMKEITDWSTLALILGIKQSVSERIKIDGYDEMDRIKKMVMEWLDSGTASWNGLVLALNNPLVKRNDLAKKLSEEHPWIPE